MGRRIALQHDVISALADDDAVAHDDGPISLITFFHCLVAKRLCPCECNHRRQSPSVKQPSRSVAPE